MSTETKKSNAEIEQDVDDLFASLESETPPEQATPATDLGSERVVHRIRGDGTVRDALLVLGLRHSLRCTLTLHGIARIDTAGNHVSTAELDPRVAARGLRAIANQHTTYEAVWHEQSHAPSEGGMTIDHFTHEVTLDC